MYELYVHAANMKHHLPFMAQNKEWKRNMRTALVCPCSVGTLVPEGGVPTTHMRAPEQPHMPEGTTHGAGGQAVASGPAPRVQEAPSTGPGAAGATRAAFYILRGPPGEFSTHSTLSWAIKQQNLHRH